ncbi:MAG: hypothetical protein NTX88_01910 [Candidatus Atribacteria bacterium]|nr:hypothetical protein [Candidatus Atribacteria bacterium]
MSQIPINAFFNFCRVKVVKPSLDQEKKRVNIAIHPDEHYHLVCHHCQQPAKRIHSYNDRMVRDLDGIDAK